MTIYRVITNQIPSVTQKNMLVLFSVFANYDTLLCLIFIDGCPN